MSRSVQALFTPFSVKNVTLPNRIVMAPMTRSKSPGGIPGEDVAAYYRRRAEGGVGLIVTEGTYPPDPAAGFDPGVPCLYGQTALKGWTRVVDQVHAAGGHIFSQLWHVGLQVSSGPPPPPGVHPVGPSGEYAMTQREIDISIEAYAQAARSAQEIGFDGVEIHAAHGYLIDQFFWEKTNAPTATAAIWLPARASRPKSYVKSGAALVPIFPWFCDSRNGKSAISMRSS
jgi:2,4-dienoyl-CoA reductase-like NADH-dependent reductase (Old Yellow Enzyme family)